MSSKPRNTLTGLLARAEGQLQKLGSRAPGLAQSLYRSIYRSPWKLSAAFAVAAGTMLGGYGALQHPAAAAPTTTSTGGDAASLTTVKGRIGYEYRRNAEGQMVELNLNQRHIMVDDAEETTPQRQRRESRLLALLGYAHDNPKITRQIQRDLPDAGRADGIFGANTAAAVIAFLKDKPDAIARISPLVLERLLSNERDATMALVQSSAAARDAAIAKINTAAAPSATRRDRTDAQIWLATFGVYTGAIDGLRRQGHKDAENSFFALNTKPDITPDIKPAPSVTPPAIAIKPVTHCAATLGDVDASTPLDRTDIAALQNELKKCGLNVAATGTFDRSTAGALMTYLEKNQADVPRLSSWLVQQLLAHGNQAKLSALINNNPSVLEKTSFRMERSIRDYNGLSKQDMAALQTWMRAMGIYNGPLNGEPGKATRSAADTLKYYLASADISEIRRQQLALLKPAPHANTPDQTPPVTAPLDLDNRTIVALARNDDFRQALITGNMARAVMYLEAVDTTPLVLKKPIHVPSGDRGFGVKLHPIHKTYEMHQGQDYRADRNTDIMASAAGRVVLARKLGGYGHTVIIDHGRGIQTLSAHLLPHSTTVNVGDMVSAGQKIGGVGRSGTATGNHLHHEILVSDDRGVYRTVDSQKFLNRDLGDYKVRLASLSDAFSNVSKSGWSRNATLSNAMRKRDNLALTPSLSRTLLTVLEAEPSLMAAVPKTTIDQLNRLGFRADLARLAYAAPAP